MQTILFYAPIISNDIYMYCMSLELERIKISKDVLCVLRENFICICKDILYVLKEISPKMYIHVKGCGLIHTCKGCGNVPSKDFVDGSKNTPGTGSSDNNLLQIYT